MDKKQKKIKVRGREGAVPCLRGVLEPTLALGAIRGMNCACRLRLEKGGEM